MSLRLRQSFRLWKGTSIGMSIPLTGGGRRSRSSGCGLLGILAAGVAGLFSLLGIGQKPSTPPVQHLVPQNNHAPAPPSVSMPPLTTTVSGADSEAPQLGSTPAAKVMAASFEGITGRSLFERLGLSSKGFTFTDRSSEAVPFWTCRKTDPNREYTITMLGDSAGRVTALTAEIVMTAETIEPFAKSYFASVANGVLTQGDQSNAKKWIEEKTGTVATSRFGNIWFALDFTGSAHRRLTLKPE